MAAASFAGKVAIVTGAGQGIGEGYAKGLAARGCAVVVADINEAQGQRVADEIGKAGGQARFGKVDVSNEASAKALAEQAVAAFGHIDYLVNNAAMFGNLDFNPLMSVDLGYLNKLISVNMLGAVVMTRAVVPHLKQGAAIVNQSSTAAWMNIDYYSITKLALNGITCVLARELGPKGIRVNAIAPGPTDTQALRDKVPQPYIDAMVGQMPIARLGQPDDLLKALAFLLSDDAAWVTGLIMNVDGGQLMRA
ncbi:SDR family oxidoreductase [Solimonas terrae]|uniref:SDR family oxidoreductase n=1 Tax=Solimonas terrae TaxID=1396819 RepID=A0A6M2BS60_9GAMM|nr:SDR family oxidoreductase [Solimonas terrae]NGY04869.1 SDR family oxidoreductase [Solimonas terrae]